MSVPLAPWQGSPHPQDPDWLAIAAEQLRHEAERARVSPRGRHPEIAHGTHAAALLFAARMLEGWADAYQPAPVSRCPLHGDGLSCPPDHPHVLPAPFPFAGS